MQTNQAVIQLNNLVKRYDNKAALDGVSCTVARGEIFGLLGPSGAGKTTIINILTGQVPKTAGNATLMGADTGKIPEGIYAQVGMMLDSSGVYKRLSVYQNLEMFTDIYGVPKSRIAEVLAQVGLAGNEKKAVEKLSKGMLQRLVLARAILHRPAVLFLDEPTSGLDPATMREIHSLIFSLRDEGATIFLTTHNMEEATVLCDHVALLNAGKIVEYGAPGEVCRRHNTDKRVEILLQDGSTRTLPATAEAADELAALLRTGKVEALHSSEPTLETVFIKLTGRKLS